VKHRLCAHTGKTALRVACEGAAPAAAVHTSSAWLVLQQAALPIASARPCRAGLRAAASVRQHSARSAAMQLASRGRCPHATSGGRSYQRTAARLLGPVLAVGPRPQPAAAGLAGARGCGCAAGRGGAWRPAVLPRRPALQTSRLAGAAPCTRGRR